MPNNIIMADQPSGEWTTEEFASKTAPSGDIVLTKTSYPNNTIAYCLAVTQVVFENATTSSQRMVADCSNVTRIIAQKITTSSPTLFYRNGNLAVIDIMGGGAINANLAFAQNPKLKTFIIRASTAKDIGNNALQSSYRTNDPINVYVPEDTIQSYEALQYWGSLVTQGYVVFHKLEGSDYESLDWWRN